MPLYRYVKHSSSYSLTVDIATPSHADGLVLQRECNCGQHGQCIFTIGGSKFRCKCQAGYIGSSCATAAAKIDGTVRRKPGAPGPHLQSPQGQNRRACEPHLMSAFGCASC